MGSGKVEKDLWTGGKEWCMKKDKSLSDMWVSEHMPKKGTVQQQSKYVVWGNWEILNELKLVKMILYKWFCIERRKGKGKIKWYYAFVLANSIK